MSSILMTDGCVSHGVQLPHLQFTACQNVLDCATLLRTCTICMRHLTAELLLQQMDQCLLLRPSLTSMLLDVMHKLIPIMVL